MNSSMIYSMGTALDRAREHQLAVDVLVSGVWLSGLVVASDGHGVVLETDDHEHAVLRLEAIMAIRVHAAAPTRVVIPAQPRAWEM